MSAVLEAYKIEKSYEGAVSTLRAVNGVSLRIEPSEFVALVGPSGCGKSTLLNIIGLVDRPSAGTLSIAGRTVDFEDEEALVRLRRTAVGYVFQHFHLLPTLSARENVMMPLVLGGTRPAQAEKRANDLLDRVGLSLKGGALPFTLSGGEMQRVAVARAVAHSPNVVLADEPTGNLDSVSGALVLELLSELSHEGTAVLMATHSDDAVRHCNRIIRMKDGRQV